MRSGIILIIFLLFQLVGSISAQNTLLPTNQGLVTPSTVASDNICSGLFGINQAGEQTASSLGAILPQVASFTTYNFMLEFSVEIVLLVLLIFAILYAIGVGFTLPRLITFVRTEYLESVLNLVLIVMLFLGMAFLAQGMSFLTNLGGSIVTASGVQTTSAGYVLGAGASSSTVPQLYSSICNVYFNDAALHFGGLILLSGDNLIYSIASGVKLSNMPNGMGFVSSPLLNGLVPFMQVISFMTPLITGAIIVELGIVFLLALIYYLFPLFLFTGVLLRCFPWTRAAGGTLLALFIGFYIFFPTLLYPFASVDYRCLAAQQTICTAQAQQALNLPPIPSNLADTVDAQGKTQQGLISYVASLPGSISTFFAEGQFIALMDFWIFSIINASFQIFGVVLSFVISYNLLEGFADVLGAPALQAKQILKNVI